MQLVVVTPVGVLLDIAISKITFETPNGYYTLLPRHVDFISALNAGIITYRPDNEAEKYMACHQGVAVKKGNTITLSVQDAILGTTLPELQNLIKSEFKQNEEKRKELNTAMARLELGLVRGFRQLQGEIDG